MNQPLLKMQRAHILLRLMFTDEDREHDRDKCVSEVVGPWLQLQTFAPPPSTEPASHAHPTCVRCGPYFVKCFSPQAARGRVGGADGLSQLSRLEPFHPLYRRPG